MLVSELALAEGMSQGTQLHRGFEDSISCTTGDIISFNTRVLSLKVGIYDPLPKDEGHET